MMLGTLHKVSGLGLPQHARPFPGSAEATVGANSCLLVLDMSQSAAVKGTSF